MYSIWSQQNNTSILKQKKPQKTQNLMDGKQGIEH